MKISAVKFSSAKFNAGKNQIFLVIKIPQKHWKCSILNIWKIIQNISPISRTHFLCSAEETKNNFLDGLPRIFPVRLYLRNYLQINHKVHWIGTYATQHVRYLGISALNEFRRFSDYKRPIDLFLRSYLRHIIHFLVSFATHRKYFPNLYIRKIHLF